MLDILKNIKENFDDIKNNKSEIIDNNLNTNNRNLNINYSTKKNDKVEPEPENTLKKLKDNTLFWIIIGLGIFVFMLVIIILIRYLFYSSEPSQETLLQQQPLQQPLQQSLQQPLQQPLPQQFQQSFQQPLQAEQLSQQPIFSIPQEKLQQYENYNTLKTINNNQIQESEELKKSLKTQNDAYYDNDSMPILKSLSKSKSLSEKKSLFDNFNNEKDIKILSDTEKDNIDVQNIPSLPSKNSKSFVEKATSSLATFFSFTPTNKEGTINELKPEKDELKEELKEEQKKIGGSKRKYTKQKQNKKQSVKKTNRKGKK